MKKMALTKAIKRGIAVLLQTAVLSVALAATVSAAPNSLLDTSATCSITIHKYSIDSLANAGTAADGTEQTPPATATPLAGVSFTVTRVDAVPAVTDPVTPPTPTVAPNDYQNTIVTNAEGNAELDGLAQGIYYVEEAASVDITTPTAPFYVELPMTNPNGDGWLYDVHVYPKNVLAAAPELEKFVSAVGTKTETASRGEDVTWIIQTDIPTNISTATTYEVSDTLNAALTYVADSVVVTPVDATNVKGTAFTEITDYTLLVSGQTVTVTLTADGKTKAANELTAGNTKLQIELDTELGAAFPVCVNVANNATLTLDPVIGSTITATDDNPPEVHTGSIKIIKNDKDTPTTLLAGAQFKIYTSSACTNPVLDATGNEIVLTTNASGEAVLQGIACKEYYLLETKAPDGYNLLEAPQAFNVSAAAETIVNVANDKDDITLPLTGGTGTVIFTVVGVSLIGAAIVLLLVYRKKASNNAK